MIIRIITLAIMTFSWATWARGQERGKYLVRTMGCNDCHSAMYSMKEGATPESQWLTGSPVGFKGPWGTTYPTNLRQRVDMLTENQWVAYIKNLKARPPMPYYDVKSIAETDLRSIYRFIKSLGPSSNAVPGYLPPGEEPKTPYIDFSVKGMK